MESEKKKMNEQDELNETIDEVKKHLTKDERHICLSFLLLGGVYR